MALYLPDAEPRGTVLFLSGDGGWERGVLEMAELLRSRGFLVAGIDTRRFRLGRPRPGSRCEYPAGTLEQVSLAAQQAAGLPAYQRPVLVGYSSGATLVYAALAQAPEESFRGGVSLGFCPGEPFRRALCRGAGLTTRKLGAQRWVVEPAAALQVPWVVLHGARDKVCAVEETRQFVAAVPSGRFVPLPRVGHGFSVTERWAPQLGEAVAQLAAAGETPTGATVAAPGDLPIVEVPARPPDDPRFAILLTGDGGWASLVKTLAAALAERGIPVVGWDALKYFWRKKTPEEAAAALETLIRRYGAKWERNRVLLIGYSSGADVLPFLANRLSNALRGQVELVTLLGPSPTASFEIHVSGWLGITESGGMPLLPELERMGWTRGLCLYGSDDEESLCNGLGLPHVAVRVLPGGHHFGGNYALLAEVILEAPVR